MRSCLLGAVYACLASLSITGAANAAFVLTIDDPLTGGVDITVTDGGVGDASAVAGSIVYNGSLGAFIVVVSTGTSKPLITGNPQLLDLNSVQVSGAAGDLVISLTDTDYTGTPPALEGLFGGTVSGSIDFDFFYDNSNTAFGTGTSIFNSVGNTNAFSGSGGGPASLDNPYSLTIVASITQSSTSVSSFDAEIRAVPVPAALWLFGSGLLGLVGVAKRKKA